MLLKVFEKQTDTKGIYKLLYHKYPLAPSISSSRTKNDRSSNSTIPKLNMNTEVINKYPSDKPTPILASPHHLHFFPSTTTALSLNPIPGIPLLSANELITTLILLNAIAKLAHTGSSLTCCPPLLTGYNTPAATGTANTLYTSAHPKLNMIRRNTARLSPSRVSTACRFDCTSTKSALLIATSLPDPIAMPTSAWAIRRT